jgi:hypothetical protein
VGCADDSLTLTYGLLVGDLYLSVASRKFLSRGLIHRGIIRLMSEFVGVKNSFDFMNFGECVPSILKREAIILDRIAVNDLGVLVKDDKDSPVLPEQATRDVRWLYEQGILFNPNVPIKTPRPDLSPQFQKYASFANEVYNKVEELHTQISFDQIKYLYEMSMIAAQGETRAVCLYLREVEQVDACLAFSHVCHPEGQTRGVLDIVLTQLPMPDDTVSWEHILEFRSDPDSYSKFLALRNWMNEVARAKLTPIEIEQKLEYLIDQYWRHMQLHKMKANAGVLQTAIVSTAELIEDLVKIRWGKMAKNLFAFRERRIALLEGELTAPGSEVAYIVKANERFSR